LPKPIGILAFQTNIARQVLQACVRAGAKVPEQVSVVSCDDDPMLADVAVPTISAAVLPSERLGYEAAKLLHQILNGVRVKDPVLVEPSGVLHVRQSSDVSALSNREVHRALQYIRVHATEPIRIPVLARAMGISRRKLELDFARVTGHAPSYAIARARLDLAKQFLVETHWPMERVAARSGMGSEPALRRAFVEHEKMTPGQYRIRFGTS
jgi:LacI family transcriptional regulator